MTGLDALLPWFRANRRDLPWRTADPRDPYAVWISEIMLQQTTVATVIPFFVRWLARFPNVESVALAEESEIFAQWQGLGYYRRARFIHEAARQIVALGRFPQSQAEWRTLPGIGDYTSSAISSLTVGEPVAAIDGNGERVYARFCADDSTSSTLKKQAKAWAKSNLNRSDPGMWNEALIELGATVCTPRNPRCAECPVRTDCQAFRMGRTHELPRRIQRATWKQLVHQSWVVTCNDQIGLIQAGTGEWWTGLMFPPRDTFDSCGTARLASVTGSGEPKLIGSFGHVVTRHKITVHVFSVQVDRPARALLWYPISELAKLPISAPGRRSIELAFAPLRSLPGLESPPVPNPRHPKTSSGTGS